MKKIIRVKRNQFWKKRDTGQIIRINRKEQNNSWATLRMGKGSSLNKAHTICEHDIVKHYDRGYYIEDNFFLFEDL